MATTTKKRLMSARFALPLGAVLALLAFFFIYYFVVITHHEESLDKRAFRSLGAISLQFRDLVTTYGAVFHGAAMQGKAERKQGVLTFLAAQGSKIDDVDECKFSPDKAYLLDGQEADGTTANVIPYTNGYSLELASNGQCAHVPLSDALAPLVASESGDVFDDVVLSDASGAVLYQTNRSGVHVDDLTALSLPGNTKLPIAPSSSKGVVKSEVTTKQESSAHVSDVFVGFGGSSIVSQVSLAGTIYRAYMTPLRLPLARPTASARGVGVKLVLCGLMLQKHFTTQSRALPFTVL